MKTEKIEIEKAKALKYVDNDFYSRMFKLVIIVLIISTVLKLFGSGLFENTIFSIEDEYSHNRIIVNAILYSFNVWLIISIASKRILNFKETVILLLTSIGMNVMLFYFVPQEYKFLIEITYLLLFTRIITDYSKKKIVLEILFISILTILFQMISMHIKDIKIIIGADTNLAMLLIWSIDYYFMLVLLLLFAIKGRSCLYVRFIILFTKHKSVQKNVSKNEKVKLKIDGIDDGDMKLFILFTIIITVVQGTLVFALTYFIHNTIMNTLIILISFFIMRSYFGKSYHSDSIIICTFTTIFIFYIATVISLPLNISILSGVFVGGAMSFGLHHLYFYKKYSELIKNKEDTIIEEEE